MVAGFNIGSGVLADLARINCRYLLEWHTSSGLYRALSLPLPPRSFSITQEAPSLTTYTLDGPPIREIGRYRQRTITLSGSAGYDARVGYSRKGEITVQAGPVILREFRGFLEDYQRAAVESTSPDLTPKNHLIFRALDEDYHLGVEVGSYEESRDAEGAHFAPDFVLRLDAYDDSEKVRPFESLQQNIDAIRSMIDGVNAAVGVASVALNGSVGVVNLVLSPLDSLHASAAALDAVGQSLRDVISLPSDVVGRVANTALSLRTTITQVMRDVDTVPDSLSAQFNALKIAIAGADEAQSQAEALSVFAPIKIATITSDPLTISRAPELPSMQSPTRSRSVVYRLRLGESLYDIARRLLGDADRWEEIAVLNGWLDPFRLASGRLAQAGDLVLLPVEDSTAPTRINDDLFGEDLKLLDNDLILDQDLLTISGPPNLEQGIYLRLSARSGETPIYSNYGIPALIGLRLGAENAGYFSAHVNEQLLRDPRVESVSVIEMSDQGDTLSLDLEVTSSQSSHLSTRVSLGRS